MNTDLKTTKEFDTNEVKKRIVQSRVRLLMNHAFFGNMATRLIIKDATDWCPTAATDGKHLYYNKNFLGALPDEELDFVIAHEVMHCVYDHFDRRATRDPQYWNMAGDYVINNDLKNQGVGKMPEVGLWDPMYHEKYTEEIYDDLYARQVEKQETLDMHLDQLIDQMEKNGIGADGDQEGKGNSGPVPMTKEEKSQLKDEIKNAMLNAAQVAGAGNVPSSVERMIRELTEPKLNWKDMLDQQITSIIKDDYTFMKPSRKAWHTDAIFPGLRNQETIDICVAIDTSGSISNKQLTTFLSEVKSIMDQYTDYKIHIWSFDTEVHNPEIFTPDKQIVDYRPAGFGGTEFTANWKFMKEQDIQPKKLIVFTDGYPFGSWGDENYCDTLWVIHSNHDKTLKAPFGVTTHYEDEKKKEVA